MILTDPTPVLRNFYVYELVDPGTYAKMGQSALSLFNPKILIAIDNTPEFFGVKPIINNWHEGGPFQWRGYRTVEAAHKLGSPTGHEQHQAGNAFDWDVPGMTAKQARDKMRADQNNPLIINFMRLEGGVHWVHGDGKLLVLPEQRIYTFSV